MFCGANATGWACRLRTTSSNPAADRWKRKVLIYLLMVWKNVLHFGFPQQNLFFRSRHPVLVFEEFAIGCCQGYFVFERKAAARRNEERTGCKFLVAVPGDLQVLRQFSQAITI